MIIRSGIARGKPEGIALGGFRSPGGWIWGFPKRRGSLRGKFFAGGVVDDVGTVTVGVSVLMDAGSELPADSAGAAAVRVALLAEAGEDTLDVVGLNVRKLLFRKDSDNDLPLTVAEPGARCAFVRPDTVPVVMMNMPTDVLGDDRFSPGVTRCATLVRLRCIGPLRKEHWERLEFDLDSSVACIPDWVGALDHPIGKSLLDGVSMTHPSDILVRLNESDTVVDCGISGLYHPIVPHNRVRSMWRLSVFDSDSPDFLDTCDPDFWFGMPRSRDGVGTIESDCDTALLARGVFSRALMSRDCLQEFAPMSTALPVRKELPVREDWGYIRPGAGSESPFHDRPVTGSHLFGSAVCRVLGLWKPHLLFGLRPWTLVGDFIFSYNQCCRYTMPFGTDLPGPLQTL